MDDVGILDEDEFMCEVCKEIILDGVKCECEYGHVFCEKHLVNKDLPEFQDEENMLDVSTDYCPICGVIEWIRLLPVL